MSKKNNDTRLIVAPSDSDADMLYATRIFIGDPFIFLQQNGKRTLVLSDLEIDRAKKNAKADEFVMFNQLEREVQGKAKMAPGSYTLYCTVDSHEAQGMKATLTVSP